MKSYTLKIFVFGLILFFGCKEEFLDTDPKVAYFESNYYVSEDQAFQALVAAYDNLQWTFTNGLWTSDVMMGEIRSDNVHAGGDQSNADQPGWQEIDDLNNSVLTPESESFWTKNYYGIYRANLVINNVQIDSDVVDQYKAEAKFLRAFYHFRLFRMYGPIPVITEALSPDEYDQTRNTLEEVFTQMTLDLEEAIPLLPDFYASNFTGRITKTAAQALLGKIQLYWADWDNDNIEMFDKAATNLTFVVNSNLYNLLDDYNDLYAFKNDNSNESVFEIQYSSLSPSDFGGGSYIDGNMLVQLSGIRGLCADHPTYTDGWGFMMPTQNLVDSYLPDDDYRKDAAIITVAELDEDIPSSSSCSQNFSSAEINLQDWEGYWQQKWANYNGYTNPEGGEINVLKDPNERVIRYGDVLLMLAETLHRGSGANADAEMYINMVRERAVGPGDNTGNFRTASQLMADEGWSLLEVIWYERRAELAIEGDRWFDLVRSDRFKSSLFDPSDLRNGNFDDNDRFMAIPQKEIDATQQALTAYPSSELFN